MTSSGRAAYSTPVFSPSDPLVCRTIQFRPAIWAVLFNELQRLSEAWSWRQDDPSAATVQAVISEITDATDNAVFAGCIMIGEVKEFALNDVPSWLLPCDGSEYLGSDYPLLWAVIHDNLKTDETHFRTPKRDDRFGYGGLAVGAQAGSMTHTNTTAEMPEHAHGYNEPAGEFVALTGEEPVVLLINPAGVTASAGSGDEYSIMNASEGAQFYIVAALPTVG